LELELKLETANLKGFLPDSANNTRAVLTLDQIEHLIGLNSSTNFQSSINQKLFCIISVQRHLLFHVCHGIQAIWVATTLLLFHENLCPANMIKLQ
jgi:hypothetical protein